MARKTDLRITKTYKALTDAFWELLNEKPFEDITVSELCDRAVIRRATFYKHFADKYEFFSFFIKEIQRDFVAAVRQRNPEINQEYLLDTIVFTLDYTEQHEQILKTLISGNMATEIIDILVEQTAVEINEYLKALPPENLPVPPALMSRLLAGVILHGAMWWLSHKKSVDKNEMAEMLKRFLLKTIDGV